MRWNEYETKEKKSEPELKLKSNKFPLCSPFRHVLGPGLIIIIVISKLTIPFIGRKTTSLSKIHTCLQGLGE